MSKKSSHLSEEHKRKMSISTTGKKHRPFSEEGKRNVSLGHVGISNGPMSEETKRKISEAHKGKKTGRPWPKVSKILYKDILLDSLYELELAVILDTNGIEWTRPDAMTYLDDKEKKRTYTSDFFLPSQNIFLDPKNDWLFKRDIKKINIISSQYSNVFFLRHGQINLEYILSLKGD